MSSKSVIIICAQALFIQSALSQCSSRAAVSANPGIGGPGYASPYGLASPALAYDGFAYNGLAGWAGKGLGCDSYYSSIPAIDFSPTSGGALPVSSASAIAPVGLAVASDNIYEGILAAAGELPFVGTVGVEGLLPTAGAGAVNHYCGDGINAMVSDQSAFAPGYIGAAYSPAAAGIPAASALGYRVEWANKGCGCGW